MFKECVPRISRPMLLDPSRNMHDCSKYMMWMRRRDLDLQKSKYDHPNFRNHSNKQHISQTVDSRTSTTKERISMLRSNKTTTSSTQGMAQQSREGVEAFNGWPRAETYVISISLSLSLSVTKKLA